MALGSGWAYHAGRMTRKIAIRWMAAGLAMLLVAAWPTTGAGQEAVPDAAAVRGQIDQLIGSFQHAKKKTTLGMIEQAISLSISYGAPVYNSGDHDACFQFYAQTARSLCTIFADGTSATEPARAALTSLKAALGRTAGSADADRNAWALRFAFDKTQVAWELELQRQRSLVQLGSDYFARGQYGEAEDAWATAAGVMGELDGQPLENIPVMCRCAGVSLGNALFAQKKYKEASEAVAAGLRYLPHWPQASVDLRSLHRDPAEYEGLLSDLRARTEAQPDDARLHFLLGYELHYSGRRGQARKQFQRTLELDGQHAGARMYLDTKPQPDEPEQAPPPRRTEVPVKA